MQVVCSRKRYVDDDLKIKNIWSIKAPWAVKIASKTYRPRMVSETTPTRYLCRIRILPLAATEVALILPRLTRYR